VGWAGQAEKALTGSKLGWMMPLDGLAFFTSAMRPGLPVDSYMSLSAPMKLRTGGAALAICITSCSGSFSLRCAHAPPHRTPQTRAAKEPERVALEPRFAFLPRALLTSLFSLALDGLLHANRSVILQNLHPLLLRCSLVPLRNLPSLTPHTLDGITFPSSRQSQHRPPAHQSCRELAGTVPLRERRREMLGARGTLSSSTFLYHTISSRMLAGWLSMSGTENSNSDPHACLPTPAGGRRRMVTPSVSPSSC
jgi:hypothetical protein